MITWRLLLSILSALLGSFQFGYNTGVINSPENVIKAFINSSHIERNGVPFTTDQVRPIWAILVAIFAIGGMIGALLTGVWSHHFGRKRGMSVNCIFGVTGAVLMFTSYYAKSFEMIIVGRFIIGIHCGLYTGLVPVYLSEIAYSDVRGALGVGHQLGVTLGITVSQVLGFSEVLGGPHYWYILLGLTGFPALLQFVAFLFCPESPRYLLITRQNSVSAMSALQLLRGEEDVGDEVDEIREELEINVEKKTVTIGSLLLDADLRWPLLIAVVMQMSQQLSGVNAVMYYSSGLLEHASNITSNTAQHATSGVGGVLLVMTALTIPLMDYVGRRPLHLTGLVGMFSCTILITIVFALMDKVSWFKIASIVILLLYVVFFAIGPGSIPWLIVSEMFMYGSRSSAMSVAIFINWLSNFLVGFLFPYMTFGLQDYSFLPFTGLLLCFIIFLCKFMPETKKRTFFTISADLLRRFSKPTNQVFADDESRRLVS